MSDHPAILQEVNAKLLRDVEIAYERIKRLEEDVEHFRDLAADFSIQLDRALKGQIVSQRDELNSRHLNERLYD